MRRAGILRRGLVAALLVLASATAGNAPTAQAATADSAASVIVDLRVWQDVHDAENVWISARANGGSWGQLGTIPFRLGDDGVVVDHPDAAPSYLYRDLPIAGVEVRLWRRASEPGRFYIRGCSDSCPRYGPCTPKGMTHLPLDDGQSPSGQYQYGDLTVAVPRGGSALQADREHLLELRDTLAGAGRLDWSVSTPTTTWEGVTVAGSPTRVTELELASEGLTGELSGLLGDLTGLVELRLEGNALSGSIPSKLGQLPSLTHLYLRGNMLSGCIPPSLGFVANSDLAELGLPDCGPAPTVELGSESEMTDGTYRFSGVVVDVPADLRLRYTLIVLAHGADRCVSDASSVLMDVESGWKIVVRLVWG